MVLAVGDARPGRRRSTVQSCTGYPFQLDRGVGRLNPQRPPPGVPLHRWRQFLTDCHQFLSAGGWAERAAAIGWDALALFGCGLFRPLVHCGAAGLLWAIAGGRLVELHRDWAVFELAENGSRRIFERRRLEVGDVRLPWIVA